MANVLGLNCKLYRNTAETSGVPNWSTPTWDEVTNCKNVTLNLKADTSDSTVRGAGGWKTMEATLKEGTIDFEMVYDTADTDYTTFHTKFTTNAKILMAVADGAIATTGTQYFKAVCTITQFEISQNLTEHVTVKVSMAPSYFTNAPAFVTT